MSRCTDSAASLPRSDREDTAIQSPAEAVYSYECVTVVYLACGSSTGHGNMQVRDTAPPRTSRAFSTVFNGVGWMYPTCKRNPDAWTPCTCIYYAGPLDCEHNNSPPSVKSLPSELRSGDAFPSVLPPRIFRAHVRTRVSHPRAENGSRRGRQGVRTHGPSCAPYGAPPLSPPSGQDRFRSPSLCAGRYSALRVLCRANAPSAPSMCSHLAVYTALSPNIFVYVCAISLVAHDLMDSVLVAGVRNR